MPLVFGSKSNAIPSDIVVVASGEKNGDYTLKLPFLGKITEQEFRVNFNWDITSPIIKITIAPFDPIATAIADRLNLKEGEQYKVTLEWWTIYIRLL